jgi:putative phosphoribosyl transferase
LFKDRKEAGEKLGEALADQKGAHALVLAIPRGGVIVGREVAAALDADLDVVIAKKLGAPGEPELALGAVGEDGATILDARLVGETGARSEYIDSETARESAEIARRKGKFREGRPAASITGRPVILIDDGVATGSTMLAAVSYVLSKGPAEVTVAVPVAAEESLAKIAREVDRVVCLSTPTPFLAIGQFYSDFGQVEDDEVVRILREAWKS